MNTSFETKFGGGKAATVEWYTPPYIIEALGNDFDLDPAAPKREWYTAKKCFTKEEGGSPGTDSCFIAYGEKGDEILKNLKLPGKYIKLN